MPKAPLLPTNDAIFLYFMSLRPGVAIRELQKIAPKLALESREILNRILLNKNTKYRKPIPPCTLMLRYWEAVEDIDKILQAVPLYSGGAEAVMGYFKYFGVLNSSGNFRKSS